jgi:hypothetical protein
VMQDVVHQGVGDETHLQSRRQHGRRRVSPPWLSVTNPCDTPGATQPSSPVRGYTKALEHGRSKLPRGWQRLNVTKWDART